MELATDFLIIGTGIAGLTAARILGKVGSTHLTTKGKIEDSATEMAQGGIAAAIHQEDSPQAHLEDTLAAGAGLCNPEAVQVLVNEGPERVQELIQLGARFDRDGEDYELNIEGAHRRRRIFHAGDATGAEIGRTLGRAILREQQVILHDFLFVSRLLIVEGRCIGVVGWNLKKNEPVRILAKATLLSTGGLGQIYTYSTNPRTATGDGIAMAYRAGATVSDMEFIQFHPTALAFSPKHPLGAAPSNVFLISEAVRGEGAILLNQAGERFMPRHHPDAELAPRDIVARAIWQEMQQEKSDHVYLSLKEIAPDKIPARFPTIYHRCLSMGLDITKTPIPVAPAAHYAMGGVVTDLWGQTNIPGLFAAGEVANVGIHGANRLASNSLLDGLVFGYRAAQQAISWKEQISVAPTTTALASLSATTQPVPEALLRIRQAIRKTMWEHVGLIRSAISLTTAQTTLAKLETQLSKITDISPECQEIANLLCVAQLITQAALDRTESRGAHFRSDYPESNDHWTHHLAYPNPEILPRSSSAL